MPAWPVSFPVRTTPLPNPAAFSCRPQLSHIFIGRGERKALMPVSFEFDLPMIALRPLEPLTKPVRRTADMTVIIRRGDRRQDLLRQSFLKPGDGKVHLFTPAVQFKTTVMGLGAGSPV